MLLELAIGLLVLALFLHLRPTPTAKSKALRHLPNPPSPKPRLPFIGHLHLLKDKLLHYALIDLSKRHGPLFSLYFGSMPTVVASSPELFKLFLQTHEAASFNTRFQTSAIRRLTYDNSVAMVPFGPYWKFIRKLIMNDLLNATTVNKLRPLRTQEIRKFLKVMAQSAKAQQPLNVTEELLKWTNSTISMMMLGEAEEIRDIARDVLTIFGEYSLTNFIWPLNKLKLGKYENRTEEIFNKFDPIIEKVIKKRREIVRRRKNGEVVAEEQSGVFLDTLLEFAEDETMEIKITDEQIKGLVVVSFLLLFSWSASSYLMIYINIKLLFVQKKEYINIGLSLNKLLEYLMKEMLMLYSIIVIIYMFIRRHIHCVAQDKKYIYFYLMWHLRLIHNRLYVQDFFSAGTDSTAVATEWALAELINNPRVLQKAREEVYSVVGKDRLVDEVDTQNLPYIRAIVKETFRMHPPLPVVKRKCVEECEIDGYVIPEGALILFNVWAVGRDPKYWNRPLEFRPERFLESEAEGEAGPLDLRGQHFTLLPFGSGRRMCPGVNLATSGMATLLASVIQCFDLQVVGSQGQILKGNDAKVSMEERGGLTVPRAHNLECVPVARTSIAAKLLS